jgi:hypothetical protein
MSLAERLAVATTVLGVAHHVDHVLRFDHSGWPFKAEVTPFTFSLLVYVVIALIFSMRHYPRVRVALAGLLFIFPTVAHVTLETPADQYHTWAHQPAVNLLHISAPAAGVAAVVVTILLSLLAFSTFVSFWQEARSRPRRR